jgi:hypothetical protein
VQTLSELGDDAEEEESVPNFATRGSRPTQPARPPATRRPFAKRWQEAVEEDAEDEEEENVPNFEDKGPPRTLVITRYPNQKYKSAEEALAARRAQDLAYRKRRRAMEKQTKQEMPDLQKQIIRYLQQHVLRDVQLLKTINLFLSEYEADIQAAAADEAQEAEEDSL